MKYLFCIKATNEKPVSVVSQLGVQQFPMRPCSLTLHHFHTGLSKGELIIYEHSVSVWADPPDMNR